MKSIKSNIHKVVIAFLLAFAAFTVIQPANAITLVSTGTCQVNNPTTTCTTPGQNFTAGNLLVVSLQAEGVNPSSLTLTASDNNGDTFTAISTVSSISSPHDYYAGMAYAIIGSTTAARTVTITVTGSGTTLTISAQDVQVSGIASPILKGSVSGSSTSAVASFTTSSSQSFATNDLIVADFTNDFGVAVGSGFTRLSQSGANDFQESMYSLTASSPPTSPTNFPGTPSSSSKFAELGADFGPTVTSTVNLTCIVKETGAPSETVTLTGGSPSPSTATCSTGAGTTTAITVTPSCTLTVTVATDGANTRYRFNASATSPTTQNIACPTVGNSKSVTVWNYYELQNTYAMNPSSPSTWDHAYTEPVTGTVTGVASTTGCSVSLTNGGGSANCATWFDYQTAASMVASFASAVAGTWTAGTHSFTQTTGGNTNTANYILQFNSTFTIICVNPTTCDNGMTLGITGTVGGSPATICTITTSSASSSASCSGSADTGTTATFNHFLNGAPTNVRYENQAGASSTVTINNPFTFTVNYFKEDNQTVRYQIFCILGATCGVPNIIYSVLGVQQGPTPMTMGGVGIWMDFGSAALASASVTDNKGNTYTTSTTSWKITAPNIITNPIVYSTTSVATSTTTIIAWNAPDGKHYANGLGAMFFILLGAGGFACLPIVFRRRGDFVITMMLVGALLGLVVATLPNGQAASANSLIAPIGAIVMGGALLVLWIVKGARGGPAQQ